jgi:hypothetical protein
MIIQSESKDQNSIDIPEPDVKGLELFAGPGSCDLYQDKGPHLDLWLTSIISHL